VFYSLLRCPVCRTRSSGPKGCCAVCAASLFSPQIEPTTLSLGVYEGALERAIRAYKFHGVRRLSTLFGQELAEALKGLQEQPDVLCAVPLHPTRFMQRGYNQSALVGKVAASHAGLPYRALLRRTRATRQQAKLGVEARQGNVVGAFRAKPLEGERVLLIDDVMTSGATLTECALELFRAGAGRVYIATLARAL
jgi:ComF family protein